MRLQAKTGGGDSAICIPALVMALAGLRNNQIVDVVAESSKIVIAPITAPKYDLDQMLVLMVPDTFPEDLDFGPAQGGEDW